MTMEETFWSKTAWVLEAASAAFQADQEKKAKQPDERVEDYLTVDPMEVELGVGLLKQGLGFQLLADDAPALGHDQQQEQHETGGDGSQRGVAEGLGRRHRP